MQTFLPISDFTNSAKVLDSKRLGKQRAEVKTILKALNDEISAWKNHPAVLMWQGNRFALCNYGQIICYEFQQRGFRDNLLEWFTEKSKLYHNDETLIPWWFGNPQFHASHRAALLAKNYDHYKQFGWTETPEINYVWPTKHLKNQNLTFKEKTYE